MDAYLAQSLSADNVVVAAGVEFSTTMLFDDDGNAYMENFSISGYNMPFSQLRDVSTYGHINAMYDTDGVLRHHLWSVEDEYGQPLLSFPYELYKKYCDAHGIEADFSPTLSKLGYWWIDYSSASGGFYAYSVADIVTGQYDATMLKDSIVIIGPYDASLSDEYITPIDHAKNMYGVEYLANVTNAMLLGISKYEVSSTVQNITLFIVTFVCTMIVLMFSMKISWLVSIVFAVLSLIFNITAYNIFDYVFLPLLPMVAMLLAFIGSVINHYLVATTEQSRITKTFGRYVDPKIMKELLLEDEEKLGLGGKIVDIAVLFVDIRGFNKSVYTTITTIICSKQWTTI
ncbi:MAG: CHASE2 domain-containing protein [Clostridia bacterium]